MPIQGENNVKSRSSRLTIRCCAGSHIWCCPSGGGGSASGNGPSQALLSVKSSLSPAALRHPTFKHPVPRPVHSPSRRIAPRVFSFRPIESRKQNQRARRQSPRSMYAHTPPAPPPKPPGNHHDASRISTPAGAGHVPRPPPLPEAVSAGLGRGSGAPPSSAEYNAAQSLEMADPGDQWLPKFLEDKSCVSSSPCPTLPRLRPTH